MLKYRTVAGRPQTSRWLAASAGLALTLAATVSAHAEDTIKVGILHSLSGTMAISETTLKDVDADADRRAEQEGRRARQEARGRRRRPGLELAAVRREGARADLHRRRSRWCSAAGPRCPASPCCRSSRSSTRSSSTPCSTRARRVERNVFYTGAAPNQQAIPAVDYLMSEGRRRGEALGARRHRLRLSAHHQQDPRGLPQVARASRRDDIMINYTPFGHSDWQTIVSDIKKFGSAGKKTAVVSTINGDANVPFYKELGNQGIKATDIPVVAFSVGEEELAGIDTKPLVGHLAAWNYFKSIKDTGQQRVHREVAGLHQEPEARDQRSDGSPRHRLRHVGQGGREGQVHRSRQGHRRAAGHRGAEPDRWHLEDAAEPSHHQAGVRSAKSRPTASSTWCGRPRVSSRATPGPTSWKARRISRPTG